jgi:glycosyltransferase involved in cell wall biosynthesis
MFSLSVVIIAYNEEKVIEACIKSVNFAKEVIVLDSGSTDKTTEICSRLGAKVIACDWPGDGPQRNRGIAIASGDWILCLDADEQVSKNLAIELENTLATTEPEINGFYIPFQSHYLGKAIRFGDWRGEKHLRLFRKGFGGYTSNGVYGAQGAHCRPEVQGRVASLNHRIHHFPFPTLEHMLEKMNRYSTGGAALKAQAGKQSSLSKALGHGFWTFFRGYILKAGFLDGREGFILAISNAEGCYYRYLKLQELVICPRS